ncbi:uncharacterized protein Dmoj_GI20432 [Drosophila mojavensis]|uniref:Uncharacterized protein n=1 Tax=Drosophila mojavensis TaxID=7230 RepID=B4KQU0_DROMO|nr:uncharacterized protein Dmoj_GI20432 [Drosophila mojavensis]
MLASVNCRRSRFTNLKCSSFDPEFAKFEKCKLKVIGRGVVSANVFILMLKLPIDNIFVRNPWITYKIQHTTRKTELVSFRSSAINWSGWRRYNSFQPFLYNSTCDFCHLLASRNKLSFEYMVLAAIQSRSNVNHTCPYNHNVIVDNLVFDDGFLKTLPLPQGEYKPQLRFGTNKVWKLMVEISFQRDE